MLLPSQLFRASALLLTTSLLLLHAPPTTAQTTTPTASSPLTSYTLAAANITAVFIPYGARLTHLLVPDRSGVPQDVVAGYDDASQYPVDTATNHTYFGPVVGRYANRIRNGTFTVDGLTSHIPENENGGRDTLHGGTVGYDARNWTVSAHTATSVTFTLLDEGYEGFPGTVLTHATYSVSSTRAGSAWGVSHPRLTLQTTTLALSGPPGPVMLANHIYWNLNGWKAATVLDDTSLYMPYSARYVAIDGIEVPTGTLGTVAGRPALDFASQPKKIGADLNATLGLGGTGALGYDNAFIIDRPKDAGATASNFPVLGMWSETTGIRLDVSTNQRGLQIYTCNSQNGTIPVKPSQVARNTAAKDGGAKFVERWGCVVVETQGWIDAVNHPEWGGEDYWYLGEGTQPAVMFATYDFSTF